MIELVNRSTGEVLDTDSVPGLAEVAALHDEQLARLAELIEEVIDGQGPDPGGAQRPVVWGSLTPEVAERTWKALAMWVGWLRGRYPLAQRVPLCWWRHPEVVEELTALWLAWRDAYVERGASLTAGAEWHGRWLPDFLRRIGAGGWNLACEGDHRDLVSSLYDPRPVDDEQGFQTAITRGKPNSDVTGGRRMDETSMRQALEAGRARRLGRLADSPVALDGGFWTQDGDSWVPVEAQDTIAFLEDADRRMTLADQAIQRAEQR